MRKTLIKCSDERNRKYSIITTITLDDGKKSVIKEAVYPEAKTHLQNIFKNYDILKAAYPSIAVCPVRMEEGSLIFDFISGESLETLYRAAVEKKDKAEFERLLKLHKGLLYSDPENEAPFTPGPEFYEWFGSAEGYKDAPGFKQANFDIIAGNVILSGDTATFIDYEWVADFSMPQDLVVYHCISDLYLHIDGAETMYPRKKAMDFLGVKTDFDTMEQSYLNFWHNIVLEDDGSCYTFAKEKLHKKHQEMKYLEENLQEAREARLLAEKGWSDCLEVIYTFKERIAHDEKTESEYANLIREYNKLLSDRDIWKSRYERLVNTKSWKAVNKVRKAIGRKE